MQKRNILQNGKTPLLYNFPVIKNKLFMEFFRNLIINSESRYIQICCFLATKKFRNLCMFLNKMWIICMHIIYIDAFFFCSFFL